MAKIFCCMARPKHRLAVLVAVVKLGSAGCDRGGAVADAGPGLPRLDSPCVGRGVEVLARLSRFLDRGEESE